MKEANFKETDIGKIPVDWEVKTLGEVATVFGGGTPSTNNKSFWNGDINWFTPTEITKSGKYITNSIRKITNEGVNNSSAKILPPGTILLTTRASIGDVAILTESATTNQGFQNIITNKEVSNEFMFNLISSLQNELLKNASGSTFLEISPNKVKGIQIPLPPLAEQEKIAEVLSDTDLWIESTEALLAKKRLLKKGAMQKLLSPKDDWEVKSIIGIVNNDRKLFNDGDWVESVHIKSDEIRLLQTGNIGIGKFLNKASKKYISEESFKQLNCKEVFENDVLICRLAEPAGRCCLMTKIDEKKLIVSVDVSIFRPDENLYDRRFLVYTMCTDEWFNNVIEKVGGTTHKRISRSNLGEIKFSLPPLKTQQEIAEILSSMDLEIESLENRLQKARNIKQGMMQDLLTGKVRLG